MSLDRPLESDLIERKSFSSSGKDDVSERIADPEKSEEIAPEETNDVVKDAAGITTQILHVDDDPSLPALTFRFWLLGLGLAMFGSVLSEIYWWKPQNATVSALFQLIISYVLGNAMAKLIPSHNRFWRALNPGPFNIKEHTCIVIFSSTASTTADAISIISTLDLFYGVRLAPAVAIFQTLASQLLGYGFAGLLRILLVFPTYALYPSTVPTVNLLQSMHSGHESSLTRKKMRFFWIVFAAIFCWEIVPTWMFPLLTAFSIVCLADRGQHDFVRNLFGAGSSNEGIGLFSFGFDWTLITQGQPLYWPLQTQISSYLGMLGGYVLLTAAYYSDLWSGRSLGLPWMSQDLFYSNGTAYDQTSILNDKQEFDPQKYAQVGQPWLTTTYALSLLCYNLAVGASFSHVLLWHWPELKAAFAGFKFLRSSNDVDDPHFQKMRVYPEVPQWWYIVILGGSFAIGCGMLYADGPNYLPGYSMLLFVVISFAVTTFLGFVTAVTGFSQPTQGLVQLIAAYVEPGKPIANMYMRLYGYSTGFQALYLLTDLKLGQYTKVPPRATFTAQISGTIVGSIMNYVLMRTIISAHRADLVDPIGTRLWSGWHAQSFNTQSITWGALAQEMYSPHGTYFWIPMAILIGFLFPFVFFGLHKLFPRTGIFKYVLVPVLANYLGYLPYSVNGQWWTCFVIGTASQWWARTRRPRWFKKYNYIMSAALDGGSQVIFFILNFAVFGASGNGVNFPSWWGNPSPDSGLSVDRCKST